jgi:hypothetical protein
MGRGCSLPSPSQPNAAEDRADARMHLPPPKQPCANPGGGNLESCSTRGVSLAIPAGTQSVLNNYVLYPWDPQHGSMWAGVSVLRRQQLGTFL